MRFENGSVSTARDVKLRARNSPRERGYIGDASVVHSALPSPETSTPWDQGTENLRFDSLRANVVQRRTTSYNVVQRSAT